MQLEKAQGKMEEPVSPIRKTVDLLTILAL
jgi:hypothetical protein